jgi:hypothetical protein
MTHIRGQGAERPLDLLTAAQEEKRRLGVPCCSDLLRLGRCLGQEP